MCRLWWVEKSILLSAGNAKDQSEFNLERKTTRMLKAFTRSMYSLCMHKVHEACQEGLFTAKFFVYQGKNYNEISPASSDLIIEEKIIPWLEKKGYRAKSDTSAGGHKTFKIEWGDEGERCTDRG